MDESTRVSTCVCVYELKLNEHYFLKVCYILCAKAVKPSMHTLCSYDNSNAHTHTQYSCYYSSATKWLKIFLFCQTRENKRRARAHVNIYFFSHSGKILINRCFGFFTWFPVQLQQQQQVHLQFNTVIHFKCINFKQWLVSWLAAVVESNNLQITWIEKQKLMEKEVENRMEIMHIYQQCFSRC